MKIFLFCMALVAPLLIKAQENQVLQDPEARVILDRVTEKIKGLTSLQADFRLVIEDRIEDMKNTTKGHLLVKESKYKIIGEGSDIYFDGKTMWTYLTASNEVTITEPDNKGEDFLSNPAAIFTFYNRDFKYRFIRKTTVNGISCYEIDLYPKNLDQPYSRIKLFIGVKSDMPEIISTIGKDGIDYHVYLSSFNFNDSLTDDMFTFNASQHKKVEVVDMRGIQ